MNQDPQDLFQAEAAERRQRQSPLANRMRPQTLDDYVGQEHIIGPGRLLRRSIEADQLSSLILYGPPGTGKTTLASVIANTSSSAFVTLNAVLAGVKVLREEIEAAGHRFAYQRQRTTLFVDEVHRWNKAQQDALLPHVENGAIIFIGATTENPFFEVIKPLVSRSRVFQLRPLDDEAVSTLLTRALEDPDTGFGGRPVALEAEARQHLVHMANGDARSALNALELAVNTTAAGRDGVIRIDLATAEESIQRRAVLYDKQGDAHYDAVSALIKSLRGSDPDAALYWAAKMVYAGEDPSFLFRRMAILASEDIGLADPQAAAVVESCWSLVRTHWPARRPVSALAGRSLSGHDCQVQLRDGDLRRPGGRGTGKGPGSSDLAQGRQPGCHGLRPRHRLSVPPRLSRPLGGPAVPAGRAGRTGLL